MRNDLINIKDHLKLLSEHPEVRSRRARFLESAKKAIEAKTPVLINEHGWQVTSNTRRNKRGQVEVLDKEPIDLGVWTDARERFSFLEDMHLRLTNNKYPFFS